MTGAAPDTRNQNVEIESRLLVKGELWVQSDILSPLGFISVRYSVKTPECFAGHETYA